MKIEYRKGDLFATECKYIVHGCNAQGVMGSGVAKIIRERYPEAYSTYREIYEAATDKGLGSLPLGDVYMVFSNGKTILNAITQKNYGYGGKRYVSYDAICLAMNEIDRYGLSEIAMPKIGAGLAGGDWSVISAIIESELKNTKPIVYEL